MVVIRLALGGAKKRPFYYFTVANKTDARDGRYLERVGYYNPKANGEEKRLLLDVNRLQYWISKGAQPSPTVQRLVTEYQQILAKAA